jgi:hypothetical protein
MKGRRLRQLSAQVLRRRSWMARNLVVGETCVMFNNVTMAPDALRFTRICG